MSMASSVERYPALMRLIAGWWRTWTQRNATVSSLQRLSSQEMESLAQDVGLTGTDLRTLAGKWPDSSELLSRRLATLNLDEGQLKRSEPEVLRDLQRCCSFCTEKQQCAHDLVDETLDKTWTDYCPNAQTLEAIGAERRKALGQADKTRSNGKQ